VVPFELEATFEAVVSAAFAPQVAVADVSCATLLYSLLCRSVHTVKQNAVTDLSGAVVGSSLPQQVKDVVMDVLEDVVKVVDSVVAKVDAAAAGVGLVAAPAVADVAVAAAAAVDVPADAAAAVAATPVAVVEDPLPSAPTPAQKSSSRKGGKLAA
jgi:hypothetical protein